MVRARRLAILVALLIGAFASPAHALGLTLGFDDQSVLTGNTATARNLWIPRAVSEGASIVRVNVGWVGVAPATRPEGFSARDPSSPGYNWASVDAAIRNLTSRGLEPLLVIGFAPKWAEGAHIPRNATPGTWRPNAAMFGRFATAIARRYNGHFPDPLHPGRSLPKVHYWQPWNEPNLDT